ncbi:hypothetical protein PVAND_000630 [Polypedilum vanderplanki]|uniref:Uncharacterized protein n=1 Tax=Polypedilum vanderplanki TaxID=319348 RepID=A0A9J6BL60_POLVA|nr:hypothetical protein PVAND_000630 [Polypedilum vanderplanki]
MLDIMALHRLMLLHWSIITLSLQVVNCASVYTNVDSLSMPPNEQQTQQMLQQFRQPLPPTMKSRSSEILCNNQEQDKFLSDEGFESSVVMDLRPGRSVNSCKRYFTAPELSGLFIRLIKVDDDMNNTRRNLTEFCPLSITPLGDEHQSPWRFDPCQMELNHGSEEHMKILQGRVKVLWVHGSNEPNYKLIITVVSRGDSCRRKGRHPCLKFGDDPLLCISEDLICDGIRHCPNGGGMLSDEDDQLCRKHKIDDHDIRNSPKSSIWQHLTLGIFQNIFGPIESTSAISSMNPLPSHPDSDVRPTLATHHFSDLKTMDTMNNERVINNFNAFNGNNKSNRQQNEQNEVRFIKTPRKTTKSNNLSRYGSWGYMMLGMLTVSVVLLMCGIWECIRRVQKSDVLEHFNSNGDPIETISQDHDNDNNCPQYDPPPPYSSLFPLAKDFNNSTNNGDHSAPPSIYFTASSATFLPTAPSPPTSLQEMPHLPQQQRHRIDVDTSAVRHE